VSSRHPHVVVVVVRPEKRATTTKDILLLCLLLLLLLYFRSYSIYKQREAKKKFEGDFGVCEICILYHKRRREKSSDTQNNARA